MKLFYATVVAVWITLSSAQYAGQDSSEELHKNKRDVQRSETRDRQMAQFTPGPRVVGLMTGRWTMFRCEVSKSDSIPSSVDKLLPGDIKVVGALGDSVTAGNGIRASNPLEVLDEDRGYSFSIGGYKNLRQGVITLPSTYSDKVDKTSSVIEPGYILKEYNPALYGYSTGTGNVHEPSAKFNLAEPSKKAKDMPGQATALVKRMKMDPKVNMTSDWKMVTIFIGGNDLCFVCSNKKKETELGPAAFLTNMKKTLDILSIQLHRTVVNVIPILDITPITALAKGTICEIIQRLLCPCGINPEKQEIIQRIQREYAKRTKALIDAGMYNKQDFTVIFHPFLRDTMPPITFQPIDKKATSITFYEEIQCPGKGVYIQTVGNKKTSPRPSEGGDSHSALALTAGVVGAVSVVLAFVAVLGAFIVSNTARRRVNVHDVVV